MKVSIEQVLDHLARKGDERPEESYWQDFLCEFHRRQREQLVAQSGFRATAAQFSAWLGQLGPSKWAYGAGVCYAALTIGFLLAPHNAVLENPVITPVNYQVIPGISPPLQQLDQLDLSPSTQGHVGEQIF